MVRLQADFSGLALRARSCASRALVYHAGPADPPVLQATRCDSIGGSLVQILSETRIFSGFVSSCIYIHFTFAIEIAKKNNPK